jgi:nitrogen regulatory protein PII
MNGLSLLFCIVPHNKGELLSSAAIRAGCGGGTVLMGRSVSGSTICAVLGLGEVRKDLIWMIVPEEKKNSIIAAIELSTAGEKRNFGQLISIEIDTMVKAGSVAGSESDMSGEKNHEMICVIVNKGYADDAMAAARLAGAGGGTIINARGTAKETDAKFFGMHIVPEKEMLVIIVENDKKTAVMEAVRSLKCLAEPGSGIAFSAGADNFMILGKKD